MKQEEVVMASDKSKEKSKGLLIFMLALLFVYAVITLAMVGMFEYYTVSTSDGDIIFSISMSWQILLFVAEFVTIIMQIIYLAKTLKKREMSNYKMILYAGITGAVPAFITDIILAVTQGFVVNPTAVFFVYAILIAGVRALVLPIVVKRYIYS